jgi:DNA-binding transcriptional LysR family regulator
MMRWDDLQYLLAVCREGTLTGAGARLGVTHTTVGRRIRALEDRLGVRLLDRTPTGLRPTADGEEVLEVATRMEEAVSRAERRVMGRDDDLAGELCVSLFDFLLWACGPALKSFVDGYPEVALILHTSLENVSLAQREADVVMRLTDTPPERLVGRRVATLGFAPYAHVDLVAAAGADASLAAFPWVGVDPRSGGRWLDGWLAEHAPGARITVRPDRARVLHPRPVAAHPPGAAVHAPGARVPAAHGRHPGVPGSRARQKLTPTFKPGSSRK